MTHAGASSHAERVAFRFSILTPTLNRAAMLREAIASVVAQDWPETEHIVADGGSADGTLEMLAGMPNVRVISGPDNGIYDGLNKALAAARGDIVGWLNSDDLYAEGAFASAAAAFTANPDLAAVCGGARIEAKGVVERIFSSELVADLTPGALLIGPTLPNAWFFRRSALEGVGVFATDLRYVADSDFMQRFAQLHLPYALSRTLFYCYRRHADSVTLRDNNPAAAVRVDMLRLAEKWRDDSDPSVRTAARALEGRCRAVLSVSAMRRGDLAAAFAHLSHTATIVCGLSDYATRRFVPRLRNRRLGTRAS
ncbi:MAG: glycosyltransferase family 2 protein [Caulobacteraceae bacterium]